MDFTLYIAVAGVAIGVVGCVFAFTQKRRIDQVLNLGGKDLEKELSILKQKIEKNDKSAETLQREVSEYLNRAKGATQKVVLERYDAYEDVGGAQSFVLVMLDANNTGVLINVIHGRTSTRVYGKKVEAGKVEATLAEEETRALNSLLIKQ